MYANQRPSAESKSGFCRDFSACASNQAHSIKTEDIAEMGVLTAASAEIYQHLNFDQVKDYTDMADTGKDVVPA